MKIYYSDLELNAFLEPFHIIKRFSHFKNAAKFLPSSLYGTNEIVDYVPAWQFLYFRTGTSARTSNLINFEISDCILVLTCGGHYGIS